MPSGCWIWPPKLTRLIIGNLWEDPPPFFETEREGLIYSLSNRRREKAPPLFGGLPAPEGYAQLLGFSTRLYGNTSESLLKFMMRSLPDEFRQHLEEKVPLENFDSTTEWIFALKSEVDNVLLPMVRGSEPKASGYAAAASEFLTDDRIIEDLAIEERLDAHIDRAMKRLFQLKLGRQLHAKVQPKMVVYK